MHNPYIGCRKNDGFYFVESIRFMLNICQPIKRMTKQALGILSALGGCNCVSPWVGRVCEPCGTECVSLARRPGVAGGAILVYAPSGENTAAEPRSHIRSPHPRRNAYPQTNFTTSQVVASKRIAKFMPLNKACIRIGTQREPV